MNRKNFNTIICLKNFDYINENFGNDFIVEDLKNLEAQISKSRGCVVIDSFDNVDFKNLLAANIDSPARLFGFCSSIKETGQERIYPNIKSEDCSDYMLFSNCYIIPAVADITISRLDQIKSTFVASFNSRAFKFIEYKPALFLDRDGVINVDFGYVHSADKFEIMDGIVDLLKLTCAKGIYNLVVTNQAGVARGYYEEEQVHIFHHHVSSYLKEYGVSIDAFEMAVHHFAKGIESHKRHSFLRKPHPGMILKHLYNFPITLDKSYMIGDRESDVLNLSQLKYILIKGKYEIHDVPDHVKLFDDLPAIKDYLISLDFL